MVLIDRCQQQCVCHAGKGLECQAHSCKPGQVCEPSGGVLSCVTKGAGLGLGPVGLGTEDGDSGAVGGVNLDFHSGWHKGLRIEVSNLGTPGLGFPGLGAQAL